MHGTINPRSKFLGNSAAAILDGSASLQLLEHNEIYQVNFPDAYGRGILFGELRMELVGNVTIHCAKTGYSAQIEFKAKPWFGGEYNVIVGRIHRSEEVLYTINGKWDGEIQITDVKKQSKTVLWNPTGAERIAKEVPPLEQQDIWESRKLWLHVTDAIVTSDQTTATQEKTKLEDAQRASFKQRKQLNEQWKIKFFRKIDGLYTYNCINTNIYDPQVEADEEEFNFLIFTKPKTISKNISPSTPLSLSNSTNDNSNSQENQPSDLRSDVTTITNSTSTNNSTLPIEIQVDQTLSNGNTGTVPSNS